MVDLFPTQVKSDLTAQILSDLIRFIEKRGYEPGEKLPSERELSERFKVGRGAIREALTILENLRYLEKRPNSGIYMSAHPGQISLEALGLFTALGISLSSAKISEAHEARKLIEVQAITLACARRSEEDLVALKDALDRFRESIGQPDVADRDYEFHMLIFKATGNTVLMQMVNPFYVMTSQRRVAFFSDVSRQRVSYEQHAVLYECIKNKDVARAQEIMETHIGRVEALTQSSLAP
jgi:GntR family transcriptional repressor for pyruvate dehydrogenase complex